MAQSLDPQTPGPGTDAPTDYVIDVSGLRKVFGSGESKTVALDGVDLQIPAGELWVVIGLSGSGKSTLLRHLNGLWRPTEGTVNVLGTNVAEASTKELRHLRRRIGFVFQHFNLVGRVTAMENVLSGALGRLKGPRYGTLMYPKALRREALEQLDRVRLGDKAFQRADTLSGGEQQRVGIARALLQRPDIILADEPVASLDPEISGDVMNLLFQICEEDNLTVVTSLHQLELTLNWADRVVGMRDGKIVLNQSADGLTPERAMEVYRRVGADEVGTSPAPDSEERARRQDRSSGVG